MSDAIDPELVERFRGEVLRLWPGLGDDKQKLGLAVSGGPDSMAMLLLAHAAMPGRFEVATVDHGLRSEAREECALVEQACLERGIPCEVLKVEVAEGNVQARARKARYDALGAWSARRELRAVATAHHADDQAETVLMRLNRASGIEGLAGIRARLEMPHDGLGLSTTLWLIRPMLGFRRSELAALVAEAGLRCAADPSNTDARFDRVAIRGHLAEADCLDPAAIARSANHLADALDALGAVSLNFLHKHRTISALGGGEYEVRLDLPADAPRYFLLESLDISLRDVGGDPRGGDVARLLDRLMQGEGGNVGGALVTVEPDGSWLVRQEPSRRAK